MIAANSLNTRVTDMGHNPAEPIVAEPGLRVNRSKLLSDYLAALVLLIPAAPLMLAAMLAVRLTSRGPVIYTQIRLGHGGRPFRIYKIRTMNLDCERTSGPCWASKDDPRVTPVGRFLRRSHIDELPQLFNILRGEMSLVGPRPERPEFVGQLEAALPRYRERLSVRPGVTGLAQIQLPADSDLASVRRKLECDLLYIERMTLWLDVRVTFCTAVGLLGVPHAVSTRLCGVPRIDEVAWATSRVGTS